MAIATNSAGKPHFATLDALRGVAAVSVVLLHWLEALNFKIFGSSVLAVDFFFMLSGFVIAYSYNERLKKGFSFFKFISLRVIRLYPLIFLGAFLGFIRFGAKEYFERGSFSLDSLFSFIYTLFLIPHNVTMLNNTWEHYSLNGPFWSLFFEFIAYIFFGVLLFNLKKTTLYVIAIIAFFGFCYWSKITFDTESKCTFIDGLNRVFYSFTVGVILFKSHQFISVLNNKLSPYLLFTLPFLFLLPRNLMPWYLYTFAAITIFPLCIIVGVAHKFEGNLAKVAKFLGDISYPVYVIHVPIIWMTCWLFKKATGINDPNDVVWFGILIIPITIVFSYIALKNYDEPIRNYLKIKFGDYLR